MSQEQALRVSVYGSDVGELAMIRGGLIRFTPSAAWLASRQHPPLGLSFLTDPTPRQAAGSVPSWFENLLPELHSPLRQWICRQRGIRETRSLTLLSALERVPEDDSDIPTSSEEPTPWRLSLAGMQLKLSMVLSGERFTFRARGQFGRWIVKIPGRDFPELPQVEAATMAWAQASGLNTADVRLLPIENITGVDMQAMGNPSTALAVRRFDRTEEGKVHQEDFAQAVDFRPDNKYGDRPPRMTYDSMARLVRDICRDDGREQFIRSLAFIIACGNDDAHLKNWSLQWGQGHRPWLSPSYDLVATISWPGLGWNQHNGPRLALSFAREKRFSHLSREHVRLFAGRSQSRDAALVMDTLERARLAWPEVIERAPECMRKAIQMHWSAVPLVRHTGVLPT